jgi:hypothetical protein
MTPTLSLAGAQIGIRHCVCLDSCNRASSSAHYLVRRSQQRRRHCASLALRLAFHTAFAETVAVVLHHQHTTWCGAHNDAVTEPRWRSDWHSTLRLPRQLQWCFIISTLLWAALPTTTPTLSLAGAQIGIPHYVCLDSCNRASSSAHYLVRRSQ